MIEVMRVESWSGKTLTVCVHRFWIAFVIATIAFIVSCNVVSADLEGTRRMNRDNRRCASIGRQAERDGVISAREAARIARWECKKQGDTWLSDRFYQA